MLDPLAHTTEMLRLLAAFALATTPLVLTADSAHACSCVARPYAQHAKNETRVVLARAGKPIKAGDALSQAFTVLATFKGPAGPFTLDRRATPPCASNYKEGEIAILMTSDTQLDPCHGNVPLPSIGAQFPAIVAATGTKQTADAPLPVIEHGLREALGKYLHQRADIPVRYRAYAGQAITIDTSKLSFSKATRPKEIVLDTSFVAADVAYLQGSYKTEGVKFVVILFQDNKTWKPALVDVVET